MKKLHLELRIINDNDNQLMATRVGMETLNAMVRQHGEEAVKKSLWEMFNRLITEISK